MVAAQSGFAGILVLTECVSAGRLWASLMSVTGQTPWPSQCTNWPPGAVFHGPLTHEIQLGDENCMTEFGQ
jgi:hypothetical protein